LPFLLRTLCLPLQTQLPEGNQNEGGAAAQSCHQTGTWPGLLMDPE
jgi:hypothetical protein